MAEIHIQKKRPPVWPWIIAVIVVVIAAWLLIDYTQNDEDGIAGGIVNDIREEPGTRDSSYASEVVHEYIVFINDSLPGENGANENFINEGVKKLGLALSAVSDEKFPRDVDLNNKTDFVQQKTDSISQFADNSNEIKMLFVSTVDVMNSMKVKSGQDIDSEITDVKESVDRIKQNQPAKKQQKEMIVFLKESGDVLQILAAKDETNNNRY
jgi:hypothetical protein